jgi:serine phosphatase RsbU (regulator of sigma subunit)
MKTVAKQAVKHEAKVIYIFLFDEAIAEVLAEVLDEEDKRLKTMRQQLSEYTSKLRGHEITHRYDHLIGNILDYAQSQESRSWQTPEGDAEEQIHEVGSQRRLR